LVAGVKKCLVAVGAWLLAGCATPAASSSAIEPRLGHHQPLPEASPNAVEPAPSHQPPASNDTAPKIADSSMLPTAEEDALCRHIVKLVQSESPEPASAEQTDELILNCGLALAHDRRRMGREAFDRRAACMFAATAVADFAACAPESAASELPE
jgi:hypothetical protein